MTRTSEIRQCARLEAEARVRRSERDERARIEAARQAREWDEYWRNFEVVEGDNDA